VAALTDASGARGAGGRVLRLTAECKSLVVDILRTGRKSRVTAILAASEATADTLGDSIADTTALKILHPCRHGDVRLVLGPNRDRGRVAARSPLTRDRRSPPRMPGSSTPTPQDRVNRSWRRCTPPRSTRRVSGGASAGAGGHSPHRCPVVAVGTAAACRYGGHHDREGRCRLDRGGRARPVGYRRHHHRVR